MEANQREYERHTSAKVHEAGHGGAEAILPLKDAGKSGEEEVHSAKDEGHVDGDDEEDGRLDQELAGLDQRRHEDVASRQALGHHLGPQLHVSGAGPEPRRLTVQQDFWVRLAHEDGGGDEDCGTDDDQEPE